MVSVWGCYPVWWWWCFFGFFSFDKLYERVGLSQSLSSKKKKKNTWMFRIMWIFLKNKLELTRSQQRPCESSWLLTITFWMNLHHDPVFSRNDCVASLTDAQSPFEVSSYNPLSLCAAPPLQTAGTYHMVALQYSFVLSTPSCTTVTTSAVTARPSPCLSGRHTLSADRYFPPNVALSIWPKLIQPNA